MIAAYVEVNPFDGAVLLFGTVVQTAIELASREVSTAILPRVRALASAPGPVKYPIRWKSEKQRKKFFVTNGFGNGIPYVRTGDLAQGWEFSQIVLEDGVLVSLENPYERAQFVYGAFDKPNDQQPFHVDTGWISAPDLERQAFDLYEDGMRTLFTRDANRLFEVIRS